jgi:hypothetical protein
MDCEPLGFFAFTIPGFFMSINRRALTVQLSPDTWRAHAEPVPGLAFIGTVKHGQTISGLATDSAGRYFAVTGRAKALLTAGKVQAAIALAKANDAPGA